MSGQPASEGCGHSERVPSHVPAGARFAPGIPHPPLHPLLLTCSPAKGFEEEHAGASLPGPRRFAAPAPAGMVSPRGQPAGTVAPCERRAPWSPSSSGRIIGSGVAGGANGSPSRISRAAAGPSRHIASAWGIRSSIWWRGGARWWRSSRSRPGARSRGAHPPRACAAAWAARRCVPIRRGGGAAGTGWPVSGGASGGRVALLT
jgi:hypothetical protein